MFLIHFFTYLTEDLVTVAREHNLLTLVTECRNCRTIVETGETSMFATFASVETFDSLTQPIIPCPLYLPGTRAMLKPPDIQGLYDRIRRKDIAHYLMASMETFKRHLEMN